MSKEKHKPELIIIAGPNGSGKTSVTKRFLHHEWAEGTIYINLTDVPEWAQAILPDTDYATTERRI